jgi:hypothetical protein
MKFMVRDAALNGLRIALLKNYIDELNKDFWKINGT